MIHGPNSPDAPTKKQIKAAQGPHDQPDSQLYLFPLRMTYLIAAIIGVAVLNHALRLIRQYRPMTGKTMMKIPGLTFTLALIRSVTCIRIRPIGPFVFPPMHAFIICSSFAIATFTWCLALHPYYRQSFEWGKPPLDMRAGGLAIALVPFIWSTALKINPISMLTGISHARLQVYHQNFARLFLLFGIIHAVPFIKQMLDDAGYQNLKAYWNTGDRYWSGTCALVFIFWMCVSSTSALRNLSYEFFVIQHIISIIVVTVMLFIHVHKTFNAHLWLWCAMAFWIFSIVVRSLLVVYSSRFFTGPKARVEVQTEIHAAHDEKSPQGEAGVEAFRLSFQTPLRWAPGQHVYVRFPGVNPIQAHPFTIMSLPNEARFSNSELVLIVRVHNGITRTIFNSLENEKDQEMESKEMKSATTSSSDTQEADEEVSKIIEAETPAQATSQAKQEAKEMIKAVGSEIPKMHFKSSKLIAWVDGPYGYSMDPAMFEHPIFIAGGTGATFVFPVLLDLMRRMARNPSQILVKRTRLVWTSRSRVMIGWMKPALDEILAIRSTLDLKFDITIYASNEAEVHSDFLGHDVTVVHGSRPDAKQILADEFTAAKNANLTSSCVYTCGPESLGRDVSNAVAKANYDILRGRMGSLCEIALESETFGW